MESMLGMGRIRPTPSRSRLVLLALASAAALAACGAPSNSPTPSPVGSIAVLGDSYASGEGADSWISPTGDGWFRDATGGDTCHRAGDAYALTVFHAKVFAACSGATISNIETAPYRMDGSTSQVDALRGQGIGTVIISAGGDDAGFTRVLSDCTSNVPGLAYPLNDLSACNQDINAAKGVGSVPGITPVANISSGLVELYRSILAASPQAHIYAVGYPLLFPPSGFDGCNGILAGEQVLINQAEPGLNNAIRQAVNTINGDAGLSQNGPRMTFVDVTNVMAFHWVCGHIELDGAGWINDLQTTLGIANCSPQDVAVVKSAGPFKVGICSKSYHPNADGQKALGKKIQQCIQDATTCDSSGSASITSAAPTPTPSPCSDCAPVQTAPSTSATPIESPTPNPPALRASPTTVPLTALPASYVGTWGGTFNQTLPPVGTDQASLTLHAGKVGEIVGQSSYFRGWKCTDQLTLQSVTAETVVLAEHITGGPCLDGSYTLRLTNRTITGDWRKPSGQLGGNITLTPSDPTLPAAFIGNWSGTQKQTLPPNAGSYPLNMTLHAGSIGAEVGQAVLTVGKQQCAVQVSLISANGNATVLYEHVVTGPCVDIWDTLVLTGQTLTGSIHSLSGQVGGTVLLTKAP